MISWSVELSEHDIKYEPRQAIKSQALVDFLVEMTGDQAPRTKVTWTVHVDGSSNKKGGGAGIVLESSNGLQVEQSLRFAFPTTNNQAEYEACIAGLLTASDLGAEEVTVHSDSQLVVSQISGEYQTKEPILQQYLEQLKSLTSKFTKAEFKHVPRDQNERADLLARLASTGKLGNNRTVIQKSVPTPSIGGSYPALPVLPVLPVPAGDWYTSLRRHLTTGWLPEDKRESKKVLRHAPWYTMVGETLYKRGFSTPLLKCLEPGKTTYVLTEIHEGSCGHHSGARSLARKILRAGYYWPTLEQDATNYVKKCDPCQRYAHLHNAPPEKLSTSMVPWPFCRWGIDLLGPFPRSNGQLRHLVVAVDYFTKWIEAEPLTTVTSARIQRFFYKNIVTRYGIPREVVSDNGPQFIDKGFQALLKGLQIKQRFTSVEHPQTNGQAESANKVIVEGIKKRVEKAKGRWAEELDHVLWAYRTQPHSSTGETPFRLTFGTEAVIPAEIGEPSARVEFFNPENNSELLREELDLIEGPREAATIREQIIKQRVARRYNEKVIPRSFEPGDLVLRKASIGARTTEKGKLAANWEGPYRVTEATGNGAYRLETLGGKEVPRHWNAMNLRKYYS
jgi:ribonuclease HI